MVNADARTLPEIGDLELPDENSNAYNLCHMLLRRGNNIHRPMMFAVSDNNNGWKDISATEFIDDVQALAKGLIAIGICYHDRVAIMSRTRYEWTLLDFAIMFAGGIPVPIYETSSATQVAWYLKDSGTTHIFFETAEHAEIVHEALAQEELGQVESILGLDPESLEKLRAAGKEISDETLLERFNRSRSNDIATIIYTSGTTDYPRGCILTHENFFRLSQKIVENIPEITHEGMRALLFLPLAHVFARFIAIACILASVQVAHTSDVRNLLEDVRSYQPTFLLSVPRIFEKIFFQAQTQAEQKGMGKLFRKAFDVAVRYSRTKGSTIVSLKHKFFNILVYSRIRKVLGGRVKFMVSGGAPLNEDLNHFFHSIGITVLEGYGLTETTAPVAINTISHKKIGTVGRPLPGNAVRIAEDGEIYVRGICVMKGYYNRPDLTAAAFEDDWFKTGDLGEIDADGFLKITGRKKEIIITAGGKNVNPAVLEDHLRSHLLVSNAVVVGDRKPFITALITLDEQTMESWLKRQGFTITAAKIKKAADLEIIQQEIKDLIDATNIHFSRAESIKKFRILESDFTQESGHLTPSLKLKRHNIVQDYDETINSMYAISS